MPEPIGPVEFLIIGFEGNRFTGDITPALVDLVEMGTVRIIDLAVVSKDADGNATIFEMQELSPEIADAMIKLTGEVSGLLSEADLLGVADDLAPNSTAAALLVEHIWATRFADAVRAANGELVLSERIPGAVIDAARTTLLAAADAA
jgi:Family of unknown function (DUF6325)